MVAASLVYAWISVVTFSLLSPLQKIHESKVLGIIFDQLCLPVAFLLRAVEYNFYSVEVMNV